MTSVLDDKDRISSARLKREFTGRQSLITTFEELLQHTPPVPVLAFFGIGGAGKTWLINYLFVTYAEGVTKRPNALINFRPGNTGTRAHESLWSIRSQLGQRGRRLSFDRFNLVWGLLWQKTSHSSIEKNRSLLPEEVEQIANILEPIAEVPGIGLPFKVINLIYKTFHKTRNWRRHKAISEWVFRTIDITPPTGLRGRFDTGAKALRAEENARLEWLLPIALADDLAESTKKALSPGERILIFIDTYDFLDESTHKIFGPDKQNYIEIFCERLEKTAANVLVTIGSKDPIRWSKTQRLDGEFVLKKGSLWASAIIIDDQEAYRSQYLWQQRVDMFSRLEAEQYLREKCSVRDDALVDELISVTAGYPLALATIAQIIRENPETASNEILNLRARLSTYKSFGPEWRDELCAFLLERVFAQFKKDGRNDLISLMRVAAATRWFNVTMLAEISSQQDIRSKISDLAKHPFVELHTRIGPGGLSSYNVHPVVRKLLLESLGVADEKIKLHEKARLYFQRAKEQSSSAEDQFAFELEAIYQEAQIDHSAAFDLAECAFGREAEHARFDRCESVLEMLRDVNGWSVLHEAQIHCLTGRLRMVLADYESALKSFETATKLEPLENGFAPFRIMIAYYHAECYRLTGNYPEAIRKSDEIRTAGAKANSKFAIMLADWRALLIYKLLDDVPKALEICDRLKVSASDETDREAVAFGVSSPHMRLANLYRQEAELRRYIGDYVGSNVALDSCISVYPAKSLEYAYAQLASAHLLCMEGKWVMASDASDKADTIFVGVVPDKRGMLSVVRVRGAIAYGLGNNEEARRHFQQLIECSPRIYPYGPMYGHLGCAELARTSGRFAEAKSHYERAAEYCRGLRGRIERGYAILGLAEIARQEGRFEEAVRGAADSRDIGSVCGYPWLEFYSCLVAALSMPDAKGRGFLLDAAKIERTFSRRDGDVNFEYYFYQQVSAAINGPHRSTVSFRFNFP